MKHCLGGLIQHNLAHVKLTKFSPYCFTLLSTLVLEYLNISFVETFQKQLLIVIASLREVEGFHQCILSNLSQYMLLSQRKWGISAH